MARQLYFVHAKTIPTTLLPDPPMIRTKYLAIVLSLLVARFSLAQQDVRPPAVPLVACDPFFSIWSQADKLTDVDTTHWTGRSHRLHSSIRIDGKSFRLMGNASGDGRAKESRQDALPALKQLSVKVLPTRTLYEFEGEGVKVELTFLTPSLPYDIDLLSWPVTYVTYEVRSIDGKQHSVSVDFEANAEITVDRPQQETAWGKPTISGLTVRSVGSVEQPMLTKSGDDQRIDWGHLYIAASESPKNSWIENRLRIDFGKVGAEAVSNWLMVAYDDEFSIQYMQSNLRPFWRRNGWDAAKLLTAAKDRYAELTKKCKEFDDELMKDLEQAGGIQYANLGALSYRQCFAAGKFCADRNGQPLQFSKENHSNGCVATSDVFYPMAPQFLLFGPSLAKSFIVPFMNYADSERWKFPFAPHDLGQYPLANGQVYGGGETSIENQMPVEECGNLLILFGAIAEMEGNADFAGIYWRKLDQWASYLLEKGFDPENQLCTDDFAGHLAHNVNLSVKAICALGAFAKLCEMRGETEKAKTIHAQAKQFAERWMKEAKDGDHYRLAFDKPGTWSQKYNLIWDRILKLDLFPAEVAKTEMAFYRSKLEKYGLPLDNREGYTKLDWILWSATLTQDRADFDALLSGVMRFINETPDRSPLTDWYRATDSRKVGFTARPVVGGVFVQMLYNKDVWQKWAKRDQTRAANWAKLPAPPVVTTIVPTAVQESVKWSYTIETPDQTWSSKTFDTSKWKSGEAGFGSDNTPGTKVRTNWTSQDIWMVRDFEFNDVSSDKLHWQIHHDEDTEVFINGVQVARFRGYTVRYENRKLNAQALAALKPGKNRISVHCHQTSGGQYIDIGLVSISPPKD